MHCLDEFDPSVKEAAEYALGHIAKHNENFAHQVVDIAEQIAKLAALKEQGILSDEEFAAKKADLLAKM